MIFGVIAALLGTGAGYLQGGRLHRLSVVRFRHSWLLWVAAGVPIVFRISGSRRSLDGVGTLLTVAAVTGFLAVNGRRRVGLQSVCVLLVGLGWSLNAAVIMANGGMPVDRDLLEHRQSEVGRVIDYHQHKHAVLSETTQLRWLADVIPVPCLFGVFGGRSTGCGGISLGDLLILLGIGAFVATSMKDPPTADSPGPGGHSLTRPGHPWRFRTLASVDELSES